MYVQALSQRPACPHDFKAGLHLCLHLAPELNAGAVQAELARRGVHVCTLDAFMPGSAAPNALLLGHGALTAAEAQAGARVIADVIRTLAVGPAVRGP